MAGGVMKTLSAMALIGVTGAAAACGGDPVAFDAARMAACESEASPEATASFTGTLSVPVDDVDGQVLASLATGGEYGTLHLVDEDGDEATLLVQHDAEYAGCDFLRVETLRGFHQPEDELPSSLVFELTVGPEGDASARGYLYRETDHLLEEPEAFWYPPGFDAFSVEAYDCACDA